VFRFLFVCVLLLLRFSIVSFDQNQKELYCLQSVSVVNINIRCSIVSIGGGNRWGSVGVPGLVDEVLVA